SGMILNGTSVGVDRPDVRPTDEPDRAVVKVLTREVIDKRSGGSRGHEWIDDHVLIEKRRDTAHGLVGVVPADRAPAGRGVVRRADPGEQEHPHVIEREAGYNHQRSGLFKFTPGAVDVRDTGRLLLG